MRDLNARFGSEKMNVPYPQNMEVAGIESAERQKKFSGQPERSSQLFRSARPLLDEETKRRGTQARFKAAQQTS